MKKTAKIHAFTLVAPGGGRMNSEEFKRTLRMKGWSMVDAAFRWEISVSHLHHQIGREDMPTKWGDMARGLPTLAKQDRVKLKRARQMAARLKPNRDRTRDGMAYSGYIIRDSILTAIRPIENLADRGEQGWVKEVERSRQGEKYLVVFERGEDWFPAETLADYLAETGKMRQP